MKRTSKINGIESEASNPEEDSGLDSGSGSGSVSSPDAVELVSCLSSSEKSVAHVKIYLYFKVIGSTWKLNSKYSNYSC